MFPACKESQVREEWRLSLQALSGRNCLRRIEALEGGGVRQGVAHHPCPLLLLLPLASHSRGQHNHCRQVGVSSSAWIYPVAIDIKVPRRGCSIVRVASRQGEVGRGG